MSKLIRMLAIACVIVLASVGFTNMASAAGNSKGPGAAPGASASAASVVPVSLTFNTGFDVFQIHSTTAAPSLKINVLDCCIANDRWIQRTHCVQNNSNWDVRGMGNGAVTGPGTGDTVVFKIGTQPIDCITEVRYGQGVAIFPAGMTVNFTVPTADAISTTVLTTTVPLGSQ
jgi:hypothetical protein